MPTTKIIQTNFSGLVTAPGLLVRDEASCVEASNVIFEAPGIARKRKGFSLTAGNIGGATWSLFSSRLMGNNVLVHRGATPLSLQYGDATGAPGNIAVVGDLTRTIDKRMAMAVCKQNHYVTGNGGPVRLESTMTTATQRSAGMPRGMPPRLYARWLAGLYTVNGVVTFDEYTPLVAGTLLADGYARSYRVTWHRKDPEGVELGGAPTGIAVLRNQTGIKGYSGGATMDASLRIPVCQELGAVATSVDTAFFWRLWGSRLFKASAGIRTDDEHYLLAEKPLTSAEITLGHIVYTDAAPDAYIARRGSRTLHTNPVNYPASEARPSGKGQGIVNEDAPPPIASAIAYWADVMWYGDILFRKRFAVKLLATGGSGLVAGDTVTVGGIGLTGKLQGSAAAPVTNEFTVFTTLANLQMNLEATSNALVDAINTTCTDSQSGVRAYLATDGSIYVESLNIVSSVSFESSNTGAFSGTKTNGAVTGVDDAQTNGIMFSKPGRADAVPPVNIFAVAGGDARVLVLQPLGNRLLVFTTVGIFQIYARSYTNYTIAPLDLSFRLLARESVVTCDGKVYAWCYEGIVEIDEAGVRLISTPIEPTLIEAIRACGGNAGITAGLTAFEQQGFSTAYRSKHRVMFFYPQTTDTSLSTGCADWLTWDTRLRVWSSGKLASELSSGYRDSRTCGVPRYSDDNLLLGRWGTGADTALFMERNASKDADYKDTDQTGVTSAVVLALTMQYRVPEIDGAAHWQQMVLSFEGGELDWRKVPTALTLSWTGQPAGVTGSVSMTANTSQFFRAETPTSCRRGNRVQLSVGHTTTEYFGLNGIAQTVRPGAKFVGRTS